MTKFYVHRYIDAKTKQPRIRYGTDVRSTQAHLRTADELGLKQVWLLGMEYSFDEAMMEAVYKWTKLGFHASKCDCSSAVPGPQV